MLVLLRRPRISFQAVVRENTSAWFLISAVCSLSAARSSRTSWMLFHPSTSALWSHLHVHTIGFQANPWASVCSDSFVAASDMLSQTEIHIVHWQNEKPWYSHRCFQQLDLPPGLDCGCSMDSPWNKSSLFTFSLHNCLNTIVHSWYVWRIVIRLASAVTNIQTFFLHKVQKYARHLLRRVSHHSLAWMSGIVLTVGL